MKLTVLNSILIVLLGIAAGHSAFRIHQLEAITSDWDATAGQIEILKGECEMLRLAQDDFRASYRVMKELIYQSYELSKRNGEEIDPMLKQYGEKIDPMLEQLLTPEER